MQNQKRENKTKEQIEQDIKSSEKIKAHRKFIKEIVYPALLEKSDSIDDAKIILGVVSTAIQQAMLNIQMKQLVKDLDIPEVDEKYKKYSDIMVLFRDHSVTESTKLIQGLQDEIDETVRDENKERKLATLEVKLLD